MTGPPPDPAFSTTIALPDEGATARLAADIAPLLGPGDALLLTGPIGAGKTAFARALIRAATGNPTEEVPSPTFTLVQTYETAKGEIWHTDLYRIGSEDEVIELGLDEALQQEICLIEWPEKLGTFTPDNALTLAFTTGDDGHSVTVTGNADWRVRLGDKLG